MADHASIPRFQHPPAWLTGLALAIILGVGARLRLEWPLVPLSDPDTWGYLHPALSELIGHGFQHTDGRNFVYPGWVYLWLRGCGDFRALCIAQHLLGLATGALLWKVWQQWRGWFPRPRVPGWIAAPMGLGLAAFYVSSTTVIFLEQRIRPEAIFPFFAILAIYFTLEFLREWFTARNTLRAALWGGAAVFDAILCYELKPSFGFALGVALLPLLAAALQPGQPWRRRLALPGAAGAAVAVAFVLLLWPEHALALADPADPLFLPETLLTVHAGLIRDQMAQDLADGDPTPYPAGRLTIFHDRLSRELAIAAKPGQQPYESLGFNPDYLMYQDSFCRFLSRMGNPPRIVRLCLYYYERVWLHRTGAMARKVGCQLGTFYGRKCPAFWLGRAIDMTRNYRKTVAAFEPASFQKQMLAYPPARAYLAQARLLAAAPAVYQENAIFTRANTRAAEAHLRLLAAVAAGWTIVLCLPLGEVRRELGPAGALVLLFFAYALGSCLTVAVVHSMDIDRYSWNLMIFAILSEVTALAWCAEALLCALSRLMPALRALNFRSPADAARP